MTNVTLLNSIVEESGISKTHIANKMGISRTRLYAIMSGEDCRASEIAALCDILHLTARQKDEIFFTHKVV
jgi:predicted transcriptional regulator